MDERPIVTKTVEVYMTREQRDALETVTRLSGHEVVVAAMDLVAQYDRGDEVTTLIGGRVFPRTEG